MGVSLVQVLLLHRGLYSITGCVYGDYAPESIVRFIRKVAELFNGFRDKGFIDLKMLVANPVIELITLCLGISGATYIKRVLANQERQAVYEVTHIHNLLLVLLLVDLQIAINLADGEADLTGDLIVLQKELKAKLSGPIRQFTSMQRITLEDRIYCGFDTEFEVKDNKKAELLCATLALYRRMVVQVKALELDYNLTNHPSTDRRQGPKVAPLLKTASILLRRAVGRDDLGTDEFLSKAKKASSLEVLTGRTGSTVQIRHQLSPEEFKCCYWDAGDKGRLSLKTLLEESKGATHPIYAEGSAFFTKLLRACVPTERIRSARSFYLVTHYSPADLSFLTDVKEWGTKIKVLAKSIVTMQPLSLKGLSHKVCIRDTSLLTPGMKSLKSISELYNHPLLKKLDLPKLPGAIPGISRMAALKETMPELFVQYAMNDAIISVFHALKMERSY